MRTLCVICFVRIRLTASSLELSLKDLDRILSDVTFIDVSCLADRFYHEQSIVCQLCSARSEKSWNCCVRDLLRSFAHFTLYSSIVCYEIHVKLVHISVRWIETTVYRVIFDELLSRKSLIHVCMFRFCQDVLQRHYILQSMTLRTC